MNHELASTYACLPVGRADRRLRRGYKLYITRVIIVISFIAVAVIFLVAGCARPHRSDSSQSNNFNRSLFLEGSERTFLVHLPPSYDNRKTYPLVIALHGGAGNGEKMEDLSRLSRQSDKYGFIVVYPDGIERHWNDGRNVQKYRSHRENSDDVGFISQMIDDMADEFNIDLKRVYVTGVSNGGLMSNRLACELTDKIAAIAPVIGSIALNTAVICNPSRPISVMLINGTEDTMVPWAGNYVKLGARKLGRILTVPETLNFWITHNDCAKTPVVSMEPDKDPDDRTRVRKFVFDKCKGGVEVVLYEVQGGGHTWPSGLQYLPVFIVGRTSKDIDANEVIWDFFSKFRL